MFVYRYFKVCIFAMLQVYFHKCLNLITLCMFDSRRIQLLYWFVNVSNSDTESN